MPPYFFLLSIKSFETHRFFKFNLNLTLIELMELYLCFNLGKVLLE
ncbi:hypothetical protein WKT22_00268 [Candidatus Lokiarchaeum ossiferum]